MNVLFEEDGAFKAGVVLADNNTSLQVELPSGKRAKVKSGNVLLRFAEPSAAEVLGRAETEAEGIDTDFLWEVCGEDEFAFDTLAREYYGHVTGAIESAAILLRLHAAPIYFHRKSRGHFRKAPPEILQAALAGLEKKRQQAAAIERMVGELQAFRLPAEFPPLLRQLLYRPDRNRLETKALEQACAATGLNPPRLLARCGALDSAHDFHRERFLAEHFPLGTGFAPWAPPLDPADLPQAAVAAFSIDDAATTEIDDAFSLTAREGGMRIGIHIAAPGLGFGPESDLGAIARGRLSTVYMPGAKITMLPEAVIERFTLSAGRTCPALSLYLDIDPDLRIVATESRLERVPVVANLRHHDIEPLFNETTLTEGGPDFPWRAELTRLWEFACVCEAARGKPSANQAMRDYNFVVDWSGSAEHDRLREPGTIAIGERRRGSPLDKLVAELMIVANSTWGKLLGDARVAAIYRAQSAGKVRMTTVPAAHEGLGVEQYAWSSSPLRRFVDLINQWQLIAHLRAEPAPYGARSEALLSALRDFELTYAAYAEHQRAMERYWCLRWLLQNADAPSVAVVLRDNLVRLEQVPLYLRVPSLPALEAGARVRLAVEAVDLLDLEARCRFLERLALAQSPALAEPAPEGE
jgi:exoribonuclease-2